ncbi:hypothetical protein ACFWY9_34225 [Amycolatopsis sp. NPDC059027]|uniref:hypothetical protein n=1 Tax=unclassified Amycolatopsis TaxID=2618356 RepID=UPI0036713D88
MKIDWGALGIVFVIALGTVAVLATLFSFGVRGLSERSAARETGGSGTASLTGAVVCFAVCAAVVCYGIYLIVA